MIPDKTIALPVKCCGCRKKHDANDRRDIPHPKERGRTDSTCPFCPSKTYTLLTGHPHYPKPHRERPALTMQPMTTCLICHRPLGDDYDPMPCCSGFECGCMGMPTNPPVCSDACSTALFKGIGKGYEERRVNAGIPLFAQRYCLIQDDSCHWYICPAERREEAMKMFEALTAYWEGDMNEEPPDEPGFIERLDGAPERITFADWRAEA